MIAKCLDEYPRVRFKDQFGAWRLGYHLWSEDNLALVLDDAKRQVFWLLDKDITREPKRDDEGNPR